MNLGGKEKIMSSSFIESSKSSGKKLTSESSNSKVCEKVCEWCGMLHSVYANITEHCL